MDPGIAFQDLVLLRFALLLSSTAWLLIEPHMLGAAPLQMSNPQEDPFPDSGLSFSGSEFYRNLQQQLTNFPRAQQPISCHGPPRVQNKWDHCKPQVAS